MSEDQALSREETLDAFRKRAILYRLLYEELASEMGEERATVTMKRAIYRWGGVNFDIDRELTERNDFEGIAREFIETSPCSGDLFRPSIQKINETSVVMDMLACPLENAWREMGLHCDDISRMCDIANAAYCGKYEGRGFSIVIQSTIARGQDRCRFIIRKRER